MTFCFEEQHQLSLSGFHSTLQFYVCVYFVSLHIEFDMLVYVVFYDVIHIVVLFSNDFNCL